jgi:anti-sigma regulatory factor (Ser/Thr protein kinase)
VTTFPMVATSVAAARTLVSEAMAHCAPDTIAIACLLTSELATNALVHAHSWFEVAASESNGVIHVEVRDGSPVLPQALAPQATDPHGRGLQLLWALAAQWGVIEVPSGKIVWFDLRCDAGRS